ncbi:MAG: T9SS type A sorting domain-containing protein [Candidatus Sabulitectum sp.]|nr:T9SS type A sorting domain-containing protein [Candidatus Sabulitectum sp.]
MRKHLLTVFVLSAASFAVTATQTDWSGGSGVPGPVTDWGNSYDVADQINDSGSSLCLLTGPLATPLKHTVDGNFDGARSVYATDLDGDGDTDVLGVGYYANDITWWENRDTGAGIYWTEHTVDGSFNGAHSVYATDVDGDGDTDVLGAAYLDDDIIWWENTDGTGTVWTEHSVDGNFDGARSVYATDVDGDGDTDVLGAALRADDITWWENTDGTGTVWTEHIVDDNFFTAASVYATDVDGDGDTDVLGAANYADDITWWENTDGTGTVWTEHLLDGTFDGAYSIYATDVDGDGNTDVLGAAERADDIVWWSIFGYSAGTLESSILDAGTVDYWDTFVSSGDEPAGTSLGFQFRSSQDYSSMGVWSDTVFTSGTSLSGILADSTDFMQYRAILQTTDPQYTPVLNDVSFSYSTYLGIVDNDASSWGLAPYTNPSFGNFAVQVSAPQPGVVNLILHDITGRVIAQYSQELPGGVHAVSFNNLAEGVYFCTMHAGDFTATERMVVLK